MIVRTADMPTQGKITKLVQAINVYPLTFGELLKYLGDEQLTPTREYIKGLEFMISKDPGVGELSILDADYILYVFKALSASKEAKLNLTVKCDHCGEKHRMSLKLNQVEFSDIKPEALNIRSITLSGHDIKIRYTTINEFIKFVKELGRFVENTNIDTLKLASMFSLSASESMNLLNNSMQEDIALINYLDSLLFKIITPVVIPCPDHPELRGTTAAFTMSAVDIFRDIIQFNPVTNKQILFEQVSQDNGN